MTTHAMGRPVFDVISDRWLDVVRVDGTPEVLSLRQVLTNAHCIARFSEASPLTEVALLRFLIALTSDGLRNEVPAEPQWPEFVRRCRAGFPPSVIAAILAPLTGRSDVLDPDHDGLFDGPAVARVSGWDDPNARQPVSRFLPELPAGTNLAHFRHLSDEESALCAACLLKSRLVEAAFARCGLGPSLSRHLLATVAGMEPRYIVPYADTLLGTLLVNLIVEDPSRPSWVSIHCKKDGDPGPIARMTWRPRLMLPLESSLSRRACSCCGTTARPRFGQAVMVDTYNHKGSPFGSKADVDRWKLAGGDVHLLRAIDSERTSLTLGLRCEEWPLRVIVRLLGGKASPVLDVLPERMAAWEGSVSIGITSSAGNQMKIDDARHAAVMVPPALLARSEEERTMLAHALAKVFDKPNRPRRSKLIPSAVPTLLSQLGASDHSQAVVAAWLERGNAPASRVTSGEQGPTSDRNDDQDAVRSNDPLLCAAKNAIRRLTRLTPQELVALRARELAKSTDPAAWQAAFEKVWHGLVLPTGCPRYAFREALATVAPIFATYGKQNSLFSKRRAFEQQLQRKVNSERNRRARTGDPGAVTVLLGSTLDAPPEHRDGLLLRLVGAIIDAGATANSGRVDFCSLLLEVVHWNDPVDPTPARWDQILNLVANAASERTIP